MNSFHRNVFDGSKYEYECDICRTHVSDTAKHCGACNRCVDGFDHHCRWLNNCVGKANYQLFFRLIVMVFLLTLMHNLTNIFVIYNLATASDPTVKSHEDTFKATLLIEFQIIIGIACFFNLCALLFLGHLTYFHIMLQKRGMTTYEYIRWKANNTRASKIVKKKSDKAKEEEAPTENKVEGFQESPGAALPLNVDFMDSCKRLAGLMTMSANKPIPSAAAGSSDQKAAADTSDAGFYKIDPTAAMANTATNFGAGIDKDAAIGIIEEKEEKGGKLFHH